MSPTPDPDETVMDVPFPLDRDTDPPADDLDIETDYRITIDMTGRRPVSIIPREWPIVAEASYLHTDTPAIYAGRLVARQHADGRILAYGVVKYLDSDHPEDDWRRCAGDLWESGRSAVEDVITKVESTIYHEIARMRRPGEHGTSVLAPGAGVHLTKWADMLARAVASIQPEEI